VYGHASRLEEVNVRIPIRCVDTVATCLVAQLAFDVQNESWLTRWFEKSHERKS